MLIAAFTRSLRDPFVHARNAALLALSATMDLFTEEDCAAKIIPAISPALIDKEKYAVENILVDYRTNPLLGSFAIKRTKPLMYTFIESDNLPQQCPIQFYRRNPL